ncbi:MAG: hypothetical protein ACT6XS_02070 [Phreatobacter sp.]|uniref:hypothetical protein n=1 Tax=Phreatobacter sp. TaxID=1966341 RepID=UPI004037268B
MIWIDTDMTMSLASLKEAQFSGRGMSSPITTENRRPSTSTSTEWPSNSRRTAGGMGGVKVTLPPSAKFTSGSPRTANTTHSPFGRPEGPHADSDRVVSALQRKVNFPIGTQIPSVHRCKCQLFSHGFSAQS